MTRVCTYIVREDAGLAPNPYWGYCTLAVCTPNHQGARLEKGDWIAGFLSKQRDYRLLYAMETEEILDLDEYFHDPRFQAKRPDLRGDWQDRCGDNFYSRSPDGAWVQHRNRFHLSQGLHDQDTKHARVFIASRFWYLGQSAVTPPTEFLAMTGGRGIRVNHEPELAKRFRRWVASSFKVGVHAFPNDNPDR